MKYAFSFYKKIRQPRLARRPWWNVLGQDNIKFDDVWTRYHFELDELEAGLVMRAFNEGDDALRNLLLKMGCTDSNQDAVHSFQLEKMESITTYVQSSGM